MLDLWLDEVAEVLFDSRDGSAVTLNAESGGVVIGIGADGIVRAEAATVYCDDSYWHLSAAGRAADRTTPSRDERLAGPAPLRRPERLDGAVLVAATVLRAAMWEIRSVRYPDQVGKVPILMFCRAFAGAGTQVLAAGRQRTAGRREDAFRRLVEEWVGRVDPALRARFGYWLRSVADQPQIPESTRSWLATLAPKTLPPPRGGRKHDHVLPSQTELRLASYAAAYTRYGRAREACTTLTLAVPPATEDAMDGRWHLRSLKIDDTGRFRLRTSAFDGPGRPQVVLEQDKVRSFALHGDALTVSAEAG